MIETPNPRGRLCGEVKDQARSGDGNMDIAAGGRFAQFVSADIQQYTQVFESPVYGVHLALQGVRRRNGRKLPPHGVSSGT